MGSYPPKRSRSNHIRGWKTYKKERTGKCLSKRERRGMEKTVSVGVRSNF